MRSGGHAWLSLVENSSLEEEGLEGRMDGSMPNSSSNTNANAATGGGGGKEYYVNGGGTSTSTGGTNAGNCEFEYPLGKGQLAKASKVTALALSLQRAAQVATHLQLPPISSTSTDNDTNTDTNGGTKMKGLDDINLCVNALHAISDATMEQMKDNIGTTNGSASNTPDWFMDSFQDKIKELRDYHARHDASTTLASPVVSSQSSAGLVPSFGGTDQRDMEFGGGGDAESQQQLEMIRQHRQTMQLSNIHANNAANYDSQHIHSYESSNNNNNTTSQQPKPPKRRKCGNPIADGYDLHSILSTELRKIKTGQIFSAEEVMGKYLDLHPFHETVLSSSLNAMFVPVSVTAGDDATSVTTAKARALSRISYPDFVHLLLSTTTATRDTISTTNTTTTTATTLQSIPESHKLSQRKKYIRLLSALQSYLSSFLHRTNPLLVDVGGDILRPAMEAFEGEWAETGGVLGWECKAMERCLVVVRSSSKTKLDGDDAAATTDKSSSSSDDNANDVATIDLKQYTTVEDLMDQVTADQLKMELARLGMKCGGKPADRAKRLWQSRDIPLHQLPAKLFVKKRTNGTSTNSSTTLDPHTNGGATKTNSNPKSEQPEHTNTPNALQLGGGGGGNQRRVDIARLEITVLALLDQLRPTLNATARRAERRLTQTLNEKEREVEEEINGTYNQSSLVLLDEDGNARKKEGGGANDNGGSGSDDSDEEDDSPIYNPKGVPLGWDGKPIPYWLFKLHGLNHFYTCEICGNESYRGRRNFEKHFTESKHTYGMRCLGIPNTRHFHGVTKIVDAQTLWRKLQRTVNKDIFDGAVEEEYEDSHGNVLSRATYEDLARQGLL